MTQISFSISCCCVRMACCDDVYKESKDIQYERAINRHNFAVQNDV